MNVAEGFTIVKLPSVLHITGLKRATLYKRIRQGEFPPPVRLGPRAVGWLRHEVEGWLRDRIVETRGSSI
jgi:prophage regulatory protein